ncbi:hypothetical protein P3S68_028686 [Capsicum galapagoense]
MYCKKQYVLGVGSNGPVNLATPSSSKNYVIATAVKSARVEKSIALKIERNILNKVKGSPYIVRCFGEDESVEYGKKTYNLLLECVPSGTLRDYILFNGKNPETEAARYAYTFIIKAHMLTGDPTWYMEKISKYLCEEIRDQLSPMAKDFVTNCLICDFRGLILNIVDGLINHPFIQNAVTCDNEDQLINDNPFGDNWVSKHGLFRAT